MRDVISSFLGFILTGYGWDHWTCVYVGIGNRDHERQPRNHTPFNWLDWVLIYSASHSAMPFQAQTCTNMCSSCDRLTRGQLFNDWCQKLRVFLSQDTGDGFTISPSHFVWMGHDLSLGTRGAYFVFRNMIGFTKPKSDIRASMAGGLFSASKSGDLGWESALQVCPTRGQDYSPGVLDRPS